MDLARSSAHFIMTELEGPTFSADARTPRTERWRAVGYPVGASGNADAPNEGLELRLTLGLDSLASEPPGGLWERWVWRGARKGAPAAVSRTGTTHWVLAERGASSLASGVLSSAAPPACLLLSSMACSLFLSSSLRAALDANFAAR